MSTPDKREIKRLGRRIEAVMRRKSMIDCLWLCGFGLLIHLMDRFALALL